MVIPRVVIPETRRLEAVIKPTVVIPGPTRSCVTEAIPPITLVAVDAVPVRPPTKPPVAVIMPVVLILADVENPRAVVAVDAVPVRPPTKPPVAVIMPVVLMLADVENPRAVVAVDAIPTRFPLNVVTVRIPVLISICPVVIIPI